MKDAFLDGYLIAKTAAVPGGLAPTMPPMTQAGFKGPGVARNIGAGAKGAGRLAGAAALPAYAAYDLTKGDTRKRAEAKGGRVSDASMEAFSGENIGQSLMPHTAVADVATGVADLRGQYKDHQGQRASYQALRDRARSQSRPSAIPQGLTGNARQLFGPGQQGAMPAMAGNSFDAPISEDPNVGVESTGANLQRRGANAIYDSTAVQTLRDRAKTEAQTLFDDMVSKKEAEMKKKYMPWLAAGGAALAASPWLAQMMMGGGQQRQQPVTINMGQGNNPMQAGAQQAWRLPNYYAR